MNIAGSLKIGKIYLPCYFLIFSLPISCKLTKSPREPLATEHLPPSAPADTNQPSAGLYLSFTPSPATRQRMEMEGTRILNELYRNPHLLNLPPEKLLDALRIDDARFQQLLGSALQAQNPGFSQGPVTLRQRYLLVVAATASAEMAAARGTADQSITSGSVALNIKDPGRVLYQLHLGYVGISSDNPRFAGQTVKTIADTLHQNKNLAELDADFSSSHGYNRDFQTGGNTGRIIARSSHLQQSDIDARQWGIDLRLDDGGQTLDLLGEGRTTIIIGSIAAKGDARAQRTYLKPETRGLGTWRDKLEHGLSFLHSLSQEGGFSEKISKSKKLREMTAPVLKRHYATKFPSLSPSERTKKIKADLTDKTLSQIIFEIENGSFGKSAAGQLVVGRFKQEVEDYYQRAGLRDTTLAELRLGNEIQVDNTASFLQRFSNANHIILAASRNTISEALWIDEAGRPLLPDGYTLVKRNNGNFALRHTTTGAMLPVARLVGPDGQVLEFNQRFPPTYAPEAQRFFPHPEGPNLKFTLDQRALGGELTVRKSSQGKGAGKPSPLPIIGAAVLLEILALPNEEQEELDY